MVLVADTSALVSLGTATDDGPIRLLFEEYDVRVPPAVVDELEDIAGHDDVHADAATRALDRITDGQIREPTGNPDYPLDDGEVAAIELANQLGAEAFLCDEYGELSTVHALLAETRLLTTPKMIETFVLRNVPSPNEARTVLTEMVAERSWRNNAYVTQFLDRFEE